MLSYDLSWKNRTWNSLKTLQRHTLRPQLSTQLKCIFWALENKTREFCGKQYVGCKCSRSTRHTICNFWHGTNAHQKNRTRHLKAGDKELPLKRFSAIWRTHANTNVDGVVYYSRCLLLFSKTCLKRRASQMSGMQIKSKTICVYWQLFT